MYITKEKQKALAELHVIIMKMNPELQQKIPMDVKRNISANMDKSHFYETDMEMLPETKALLSVIISKYLADSKDKQKFKQLDSLYREKKEEQKSLKYNSKDIFEKEFSKNSEKFKINSESNIVLYKQTFFTKIKNRIKKLLKK